MASNLNLRTIAEGVEDNDTLEYLRRLGCDEAQGYYIARPMPAQNFVEFMASRNLPFGTKATGVLEA